MLDFAERTGSNLFIVLWSNAKDILGNMLYIIMDIVHEYCNAHIQPRFSRNNTNRVNISTDLLASLYTCFQPASRLAKKLKVKKRLTKEYPFLRHEELVLGL